MEIILKHHYFGFSDPFLYLPDFDSLKYTEWFILVFETQMNHFMDEQKLQISMDQVFLILDTERLLSGLPRAFASLVWTASALLACPHRGGVPSLRSFLPTPKVLADYWCFGVWWNSRFIVDCGDSGRSEFYPEGLCAFSFHSWSRIMVILCKMLWDLWIKNAI